MRRVVAAVMSAAVVGAGIVAARRGAIPDPGRVDWTAAVGAAVLALIANNVVCALRWRLFLDEPRSAWSAIRTYSEAASVGTFVPFGSEVYRAWGGRHALDAVVTDRVLSGLVIAVAAALGTVALPWGRPVSVLAAVAAVAAWLGLRRRVVRARVDITAALLATSVGLSLTYIVLSAGVFLLVFRGAGVDIDLLDAVALAPAVLLAAAVPSVSGVGPGLVVLAAYAAARGADPAQAATVVALLLGAHLALSALGGALLIGRRLAGRST